MYGAGEQYIFVIPSRQLVHAARATGRVLDLMKEWWKQVLEVLPQQAGVTATCAENDYGIGSKLMTFEDTVVHEA